MSKLLLKLLVKCVKVAGIREVSGGVVGKCAISNRL